MQCLTSIVIPDKRDSAVKDGESLVNELKKQGILCIVKELTKMVH